MHFTTLTLLTLTTTALALPTTLNVTISLHPRANDPTTIATYADPACKGPATNLRTEPADGGCVAVKFTGKDQYLGIHWGNINGNEAYGYTGWTSDDCSGKWFEMSMKPGVAPDGKLQNGPDGKPYAQTFSCAKLGGDMRGSLKFRHKGDTKAQGPWMTDGQ